MFETFCPNIYAVAAGYSRKSYVKIPIGANLQKRLCMLTLAYELSRLVDFIKKI